MSEVEPKRIHHYGIYKIFKFHKNLFPCPVTKFHVKHDHDNHFHFIFFNEKKDVTQQIVSCSELYQKFVDAINKISHFFNYGEEKYYEVPKQKSIPKVYFDKDVVFQLRKTKQLSVLQLSHYIDIDCSTIYAIESGKEIETSVKTLLNYSLFFKIPLHRLLMYPYKKELANILLNDFIVKEYITEDKAVDIFSKEI